MEVPGSVGWPIVGDKSLEFYRDPLQFVNKYTASNQSQVFSARFLNKPTVFVCSHQGVQDVLNNPENSFDLGYEAFMGPLFGHNILFSSNEEARDHRQALEHLFTPDCLCGYEELLKKILERNISSITSGEPFCLYKFFKGLFTEICLTLFLGVDCPESQELAEDITSLTTSHWRGIVAVPVDLKLPGLRSGSAYGKALKAKEKLLELIKSQKMTAKCGFPCQMKESSGLDEAAINNHLLLFTSALVPKVLSSICTSLCVEIGHPEKLILQEEARKSTEFLRSLFLETKRLHPPLIGGRRLARKSCVVAGYIIPKDYAVVFMTHPAQRDSSVFDHPHQFVPERWAENPELKEKLFVYGLGPRACIGQELSWLILKTTLQGLMSKFSWEIYTDQDLTHKHIPVCRPKCNLMAQMSPR